MPTVLKMDGFVVRVLGPPREHPPPHVHFQKGRDALVVIRLRMSDRAQTVWAVYGMKNEDVIKAYRIVEENHDRILEAWEGMHGKAST
jgi:hypothetical protein